MREEEGSRGGAREKKKREESRAGSRGMKEKKGVGEE